MLSRQVGADCPTRQCQTWKNQEKSFFTTSFMPEKRFFTDSYCVGGTFPLYFPFSLKQLLFIVFNTAKEVLTPSAACKDR